MTEAALRLHWKLTLSVAVTALVVVMLVLWRQHEPASTEVGAHASAAVMTVTEATVQRIDWPTTVEASGGIAAWQEAVVSARVSGLPLAVIQADVGDVVERGQLLARFDDRVVRAELAEAEASLAQARAEAHEAAVNRDRALTIEGSGALSRQQVLQAVTQAETAAARQAVAEAALAAAKVRLENTRVIAPDDGVISARNATLGQVADAQMGGELFRLIRQGRLEWRVELTPQQLARVQVGNPAMLTLPDGTQIPGKVRQLAPALDPGSRLGIAYVDLAPGSAARAAMYVSGHIELGRSPALVAPAESVVIRDGRSYVFELDGDRVIQVLVSTGRRVGDRVEITSGLKEGQRVAVRGAGFLGSGDLVAVAEAPTNVAEP